MKVQKKIKENEEKREKKGRKKEKYTQTSKEVRCRHRTERCVGRHARCGTDYGHCCHVQTWQVLRWKLRMEIFIIVLFWRAKVKKANKKTRNKERESVCYTKTSKEVRCRHRTERCADTHTRCGTGYGHCYPFVC